MNDSTFEEDSPRVLRGKQPIKSEKSKNLSISIPSGPLDDISFHTEDNSRM